MTAANRNIAPTTGAKAGRKLAAIDIGSNAVRFALAKWSGGRLTVVEEKRRPTRLGANLADAGRLPRGAVKATIGAVKEFCFDAMRASAQGIRLVATAAVREAPDGGAFVARLEREVGMRVEIIGPDEEARLAFLSCRAAFDLSRADVAVVDIGGGSVQISRSHRGVMFDSASAPLGAVRMTAAFGGPDKVTAPETWRRLRRHIDSQLKETLHGGAPRVRTLIGCGGTFAAVRLLLEDVRVDKGPRRQSRVALSGHRFAADELARLAEEFRRLDTPRRAAWLKRRGIPVDRAEILPAGLLVAERTARALGAESFAAHMGGVRDGLLRELGAASGPMPGMVDEARAFARSAHYERGHSEHVARLGVALLHDMAEVDRVREAVRERLDASEIIESAGLLHDLAVEIDYERHHKIARRIVELAPWRSMDIEQRAIVANLCRYHRKSLPSESHAAFASLPRRVRILVGTLAGILRIADGLDRTHTQKVHGVRVRSTRGVIEIMAEGAVPDDANLRAARKKSDLLAEITRRKVVVRAG